MSRKKIPIKTETSVLIKSRRRCCICFGLDRDKRIKQGQIAHLDQDSTNIKIENLVFLCLSHHDQYDSKTSQSKGLTKSEVIEYRSELDSFIDLNFNQSIKDKNDVKVDFFTGTYHRGNEFESSELKVTYLGGNLIHVKGDAFWGMTREYGPNIGQVDFVTVVIANKAAFTDFLFHEEFKLELEFLGDKLITVETNPVGYFGMNVTFDGKYTKVK